MMIVDGLGATSYSYNDLGIVTAVDGPYANDTITYSYDDQWRQTAMQINGGSQTSYSYDALGRMDALTSPAGTWAYDYVGNSGLLQQITNPNGTRSEYSYDALERLTEVANKTSADANLSTFAYGFDDVLDPQRDVRTSLEKTIGANPMQRVDYGYDGVDQLTSEVLSQGGTPLQSKSFAYDAMGNRTTTGSVTSSDTVSSTYTANRLNQITAHNSSWGGGTNTLASALQYDLSGNLTKWTSTGTGSATSTHTEYIYDDIDRLTAVIKKNPTTSANESKTEFQYDGYSRLRVTKEYSWNGTAWVLVTNGEKHRIYDGMDVVQERDENNAVLATYTRDGNIGGILAKRDDNGDDYFFHYDGSGNVVGLTDETEASVAEYAYDAYGNLLSSSGTQANANLYRYSTKEYFGGIGLYNYGYRFYSPGLGRWINRDPLEEEGGINLYMTVLNNPLNAQDEYGLDVTIGPWQFNAADSWDAAGAGALATLDTWWIIGDPFANAGYYNPNSPGIGDRFFSTYNAARLAGAALALFLTAETAAGASGSGTCITNSIFRWGYGAFKLSKKGPIISRWHFHLGPGKGLMKYHLPHQIRPWLYNARNNIVKPIAKGLNNARNTITKIWNSASNKAIKVWDRMRKLHK